MKTAARSDVIVLGGLTMDLTYFVKQWPKVNEAVQASSYELCPGGKGFNQTAAWFNITSFLPNSTNYKYGEIQLPSTYLKNYYCTGTFDAPTCSLINICNESVMTTSNYSHVIPYSNGTNLGCYLEIESTTFYYLRSFAKVNLGE